MAATVLVASLATGTANAQNEQTAILDPLPAPGAVGPPASPAPAPTPVEPGAPRWTITPSVSVSETGTDNVRAAPTNHQADLITSVTPGLYINGESPRARGTFDYSPTLLRHVEATDQDTFAQYLLGQGTLTAVPELLFLDANASLSDQSRSGSRGFGNTTEVPASERTQQIAYSASPYAQFRLGSTADSQVRYRFSQTNFSGNTGALVSPTTGQSLSNISDATDQEALAWIATQRDYSTLYVKGTVDYDRTEYSTGALSSRHSLATVDLRYPLTTTIYALGTGGYERLTYPEQSQLNTTGPTWSVGALYQLNDEQFAQLTYGHSEGRNSFAGRGRYALTPGTSVFASYSEYRSTTQQQILQNLQTATPLAQGTAIDATTGLPLAITNPNLPLQNDITLTKNAQVGATSGIGRDRFGLIANYVDQRSLLGLASSERTAGGFVTWNHELSPAARGDALIGYSNVSPGASNVVTFSAGLAYALGQTLQTGVRYTLTASSGGTTGSVLTNNLTLSITKTF